MADLIPLASNPTMTPAASQVANTIGYTSGFPAVKNKIASIVWKETPKIGPSQLMSGLKAEGKRENDSTNSARVPIRIAPNFDMRVSKAEFER